MQINTPEVIKNVQEAATEAEQKAGYRRADAFTPQPRARTPYQPGGERPGTVRMTGEADTDEVKRRAASGAVIDMSVLGRNR